MLAHGLESLLLLPPVEAVLQSLEQGFQLLRRQSILRHVVLLALQHVAEIVLLQFDEINVLL